MIGLIALSNGNSYSYDANGNMTHRLVNGQDFYFAYDAENRLAQVSWVGGSESFKYDGDGKRVVATQGGVSTVYIGNYLEWHSSTADVVKYYYAGAMRVGTGAVTYLLGDHLGSTSVAVDGNGVPVPPGSTPQLYKAWGETRAGSVPTNYQYTGQYKDSYINLYWYGSRWYDPELSRWNQPDSIVPDIRNPESFDRYEFVANNPIQYVDPGGHCWGVASAIRGIPSYGTTCNNLDMAIAIANNPNASNGQKAAAGAYIAAEAIAHAALVVGAAGLACGAVGSCTAAVEAALGMGSAKAIDVSSGLGQNVWSMNPFDRGWAIENALGRSPELVKNFPTIDRYNNGLITGIKSIDLGAKTYQNLGALTRTVQGYVSQLANFNGATWGGFRLTSDMITGRQLILAIPSNATTEQLKLLQELQAWALDEGVDLLLQGVK